MRDHVGDVKGFVHLSRAWYGPANLANAGDLVDEVTFGFYSTDGDTSGEMSVKWVLLANRPAAKLVCFYDGFSALAQFKDVIDCLPEFDSMPEGGMTPEQFCAVLRGCGFIDRTREDSPYAPQATAITCPTCGTEGVTLDRVSGRTPGD